MRQRRGLGFGFPCGFRYKSVRVFVRRNQGFGHGVVGQASAGIESGLSFGRNESGGEIPGAGDERSP